MSTKREYVNSLGSTTFLFANGSPAHFVNGYFYTDNAKQIAELDAEIENGNPFISYTRDVTDEDLDPIAGLKAKIIAEYEAAKEAALDPTSDKGETDKTAPLNPASTATLGVGASANSNSGGASLGLTTAGK